MICEIMPDDVREIMDHLWARCALARALDGIALQDVVDGIRGVPEGWVLDPATCYFLPPVVNLTAIIERGETVH